MQKNVTKVLPEIHVAIGYRDVYDDYEEVNPADLIRDIPTFPLLQYVVRLFNKVEYAQSDTRTQHDLIYEMCRWLSPKARKKVRKFLQRQKFPLLVCNDNIMLFYGLALSNFTDMDKSDTDIFLCQDELECVYKALLYCNQKWTDYSTPSTTTKPNLIDLSIRVKFPISEFKFHKEFKSQVYKSVVFFNFCEREQTFKTYLDAFCKDRGVECWQEYMAHLISFISSIINNPLVEVEDKFRTFFDRYIINTNDPELPLLWQENKSVQYLRNHFLLLLPHNIYMLLSSNFLFDKLYQGMLFDIFAVIRNNGLMSPKGKPITSYPDFRGMLGTVFSEKILFYSIMEKIFDGKCECAFDGENMKALGIIGEPDYYVHVGNTLYLFEFKDLTLADKVKFSLSVDEQKQETLNRLCCYQASEDGKVLKKGFGQLLCVIDDILNKHSYYGLDKGLSNIQEIFPIVVTTEPAFSSMGVNMLVIDAFEKIMKENFDLGKHKVFISIPLIVDFDSLINLCYELHIGKYDFHEIISRYILFNKHRLASFKTFVTDNYLGEHHLDDNEITYLLGDFIKD